MATFWENSCSFGLRYVFPTSVFGVGIFFWLRLFLIFAYLYLFSSENFFLIAPFPDLCLLVPVFEWKLLSDYAVSDLCLLVPFFRVWTSFWLRLFLIFAYLYLFSSENFLIAPFPDLCLLVPFFEWELLSDYAVSDHCLLLSHYENLPMQ